MISILSFVLFFLAGFANATASTVVSTCTVPSATGSPCVTTLNSITASHRFVLMKTTASAGDCSGTNNMTVNLETASALTSSEAAGTVSYQFPSTASTDVAYLLCSCVVTTNNLCALSSTPTDAQLQLFSTTEAVVVPTMGELSNTAGNCIRGAACNFPFTSSLPLKTTDRMLVTVTDCNATTVSAGNNLVKVVAGTSPSYSVSIDANESFPFGPLYLCFCSSKTGSPCPENPTTVAELRRYVQPAVGAINNVPFMNTAGVHCSSGTACAFDNSGSPYPNPTVNERIRLVNATAAGNECANLSGATDSIQQESGVFNIPTETPAGLYAVCFCIDGSLCATTGRYRAKIGHVRMGPTRKPAAVSCAQGVSCTFSLDEDFTGHAATDRAILSGVDCGLNESTTTVIVSNTITTSKPKQDFVFTLGASQATGNFHVCACLNALEANGTCSTDPTTAEEKNAYMTKLGAVTVTSAPSSAAFVGASVLLVLALIGVQA